MQSMGSIGCLRKAIQKANKLSREVPQARQQEIGAQGCDLIPTLS